jgi:hypothetical protein
MPVPSNAVSPEVLDTLRAAELDVETLTRRVDGVLAEDLAWFPVRHHSPNVARHLARFLDERRPKVVFIEGPSEAQAMIEFLLDAKTRPPVAIYSSFRSDAASAEGEADPEGSDPASSEAGGSEATNRLWRRSAWYPIVAYSPEYVAMRAAKALGAETVFIDLPHFALPEVDPAIPSPPQHRPGNARAGRLLDLDELAERSDFHASLARAGGYRSWQEAWDALFETRGSDRSTGSFRRDVAVFCAAVRATTPVAQMETDGTLARERFMWRTIRETLARKRLSPCDAVVVCGGFHIFLDRNDPQPPPEIPEGTTTVTVAPYSYFRISELSGYGAGNRAPRFYEMCFDGDAGGASREAVMVEYVVDVLHEARKRGEPLSPADAIGTTQHALMLARLRGRTEPILDDILDALVSCCCKGNPETDAARLFEAVDEVNIGTRLGRVTDRIGQLPILNDFHEQLDRLGLDEVAARERVVTHTLDKRQPFDLARSSFLHRLIFLGIEIGSVQRETAALGQSIFREHWRLKWSPKIEAALIERNLLGDTVETAATTLLRETLGTSAREAGPACRQLLQAVDMDLPQLVADAERMTGHAIEQDDRFGSLADAFTSLLTLERHAAVRGLEPERLADLLVRCFGRACLSIPDAANVVADEWEGVVQGLSALAEPVVQRRDLDGEVFATHVERGAAVSNVPYLRGALLGVLAEIRRRPAESLAAELSAYARGGVERQLVAGDFLAGVLRVSRTAVLLGAKSLAEAVDELLAGVDDDTFLCLVPRLRAAFESLHDRQRDVFARHVADMYGLGERESVRVLSTSVGAARLLAELDARAAAILSEWLVEEAAI